MTEQKTTVEYLSSTKGWVSIDDMAREHLVNVIKKSLREQKAPTFRQVNSVEFVLQPSVLTEGVKLRMVA